MAGTFTFTPSKSFKKASKARVIVAQFGDGYSQRTRDGLNNINNEWSLSFTNVPLATSNSIVAFLEARNGAENFTWTPTGESTSIKVICNTWDVSYDTEFSRSVTATFIRVFDIN